MALTGTIMDKDLSDSLKAFYKDYHTSMMATKTPLFDALKKKLTPEEEAYNETMQDVGAHYGVAAQRGRDVSRPYVECGGRKWYYDPSGTLIETSE